jgi:large subunit ribosomal protein L37Ae
MTRRTKKVGVAGRYGVRYGVKTRKAVAAVLDTKARKYECPQCKHIAVRRVSSGIWKCRKCDLIFAGGAYTPGAAVVGAPTEAAIEEAAEGEQAEGDAATTEEE